MVVQLFVAALKFSPKIVTPVTSPPVAASGWIVPGVITGADGVMTIGAGEPKTVTMEVAVMAQPVAASLAVTV